MSDYQERSALPLPPSVSVAVTGLLCGFAIVGLVWVGERACDLARGAANCGVLGLPLLLLLVAAAVVAGVAALRRLMLPNPGLTSFLGVSFMLLIVVGLLSDQLLTPWSVLAVPAITAGTFLIARYVTSRLNA